MAERLLEVKGLKTHFFTDEGVVRAVDGIDLHINKGETLGIVGESGSGKSVTALSVMRLIPQPPGRIVQGQIVYNGRNLLDLTPAQMRKIRGKEIAMIFQEPMTSLNPVFTVGEQIAESVRLHMGLDRSAALAHALRMLELVEIPAAVHHRHLVDHLRDDAEVVRDQQDRHPEPLAQLLHQLEDLRLHGHVERRRRLVRDQELRVAGERHRDHHALAHAARELVRIVVDALLRRRDPDELQHLDRPRHGVLLAEPLMQLHRLGDLIADGEDRVQRRHGLLEDHRDVVAADLLELPLLEHGEITALEEDARAFRDPAGPVDQAHHRQRGHGLAAARLADDAERAPRRDLEVDPVDGAEEAVAGVEAGAEVLDGQQRRHARLAFGAWAGAGTSMWASSCASTISGSRVCRAASSSRCSSTVSSKLRKRS